MGKNLDSQFPETQDVVVKSAYDMYRYKKKYKQGQVAKGRKQARFHIKDKDLPANVRRD